jgi:hypothetical protein
VGGTFLPYGNDCSGKQRRVEAVERERQKEAPRLADDGICLVLFSFAVRSLDCRSMRQLAHKELDCQTKIIQTTLNSLFYAK